MVLPEHLQVVNAASDRGYRDAQLTVATLRSELTLEVHPVETDATRARWVVGDRRRGGKYALAVFEDVIREVYRITDWHRAGTTFRVDHPTGLEVDGRWEFVGVVAEEAVRSKYLNRSAGEYFAKHSQNPILYVNC